jgi:hypothetical protein
VKSLIRNVYGMMIQQEIPIWSILKKEEF